MDFPYLAKVTKLNVAALAAIASAPPPPEARVEGAVSTDTEVHLTPVQGAKLYKVYKRRTDATNWDHDATEVYDICGERGECTLPATLKHVRVDDWIFGVSTVGYDGFESPVASAVPGGAFKPWVKPVEPAK